MLGYCIAWQVCRKYDRDSKSYWMPFSHIHYCLKSMASISSLLFLCLVYKTQPFFSIGFVFVKKAWNGRETWLQPKLCECLTQNKQTRCSCLSKKNPKVFILCQQSQIFQLSHGNKTLSIYIPLVSCFWCTIRCTCSCRWNESSNSLFLFRHLNLNSQNSHFWYLFTPPEALP